MTENVEGSDIVLEAVVEAEVARNAKDFFSQPENQIKWTEGDTTFLPLVFCLSIFKFYIHTGLDF